MIHTDGKPTIANAPWSGKPNETRALLSTKIEGGPAGSLHTLTERVLQDSEPVRTDELDFGAWRALKAVREGLTEALVAGRITTPEECIGVVQNLETAYERAYRGV